MCGIAGIFSNSQEVSYERIKKMTDIISHRGPDGEGFWQNNERKVYLGHRRLSIIDLSSVASQPMQYLNDRYTITFNGEIYNYIELKGKLVEKGYKFKSQSDTEVLLALYHEKRHACLDDLDGMFAFAIWDEQEKILFCARDRFGEKPFYYSKNNNEFLFGSEIKQLFAAGIQKEINPQVWFNYMNFGIEGNPDSPEETFYKEIYHLLPGNYLIVKQGLGMEAVRYWKLNTTYVQNISFVDAVEKFKELFNLSLKRRLRSDVPVGSSLSGGLDSSSIVLSIDKMRSGNQVQKTFSARFKDFDKDEGAFIDKVIEYGNNLQNCNVWLTSADFENSFESIVKVQDEPFGSASIIAQYFVMRLSKENGVTVLIDGQGADEYLLGYTPFFITYLNQLYKESDRRYLVEKNKAMEIHGLHHELNILGKAQLRFPGAFSVSSKVKSMLLKKKSISSVNYMSDDFTSHVGVIKNPVIGKPNDNVRNSVSDILNGISFSTLLRYADRNAMAHSVEVRLPFLNHELVEFSNSLPESYKINDGWSKYILRKSMENVLPKEITWRRDKIGFAAPQDQWLKSSVMIERVRQAKSELVQHGVLNKDTIHEVSNWRSLLMFTMMT